MGTKVVSRPPFSALNLVGSSFRQRLQPLDLKPYPMSDRMQELLKNSEEDCASDSMAGTIRDGRHSRLREITYLV